MNAIQTKMHVMKLVQGRKIGGTKV